MAKRLYFKATTAAPVSPAFGGWVTTAEAVRRRLVEAQEAATETLSGTLGGAANDEDLVVQLVSPPLDGAQTILASGTATIISRGRELATTDNVNNRGRAIFVYSNDGQTLRGTLEAVAWSASTTELSTTMSGQQHMLTGGIDNEVAAQDGDRIVVEYAYRETGTGTTPAWESVLGGTGTDHATSNNDTTGTVPWCEFSQNLVFKAEGQTITLGQPVETETAQALTVEKDVAVAQPVETETAQAFAVEKDVALTQPEETETAQAITVVRYVPLGQAEETESAQTMTFILAGVNLGQAVETETAQPLAVELGAAVGQTLETETAQAFTVTKYVPLGQPAETETAQAMTVSVSGASPVGDITGEDRSVTSYLTTGISGVALAGDLIEIFAMTSSVTPTITATGKNGAAYTVRTDVANSNSRMVHLTRIAETAEPEATIVHSVAANGACAGQLIRSANGFDATDTTGTSLGTATSIVLPDQTVATNGSVLLVGYCFRKAAVPAMTLAEASNHSELSEADSIEAEGASQYSVSCSIRTNGGGFGRTPGTYGGETFTTDGGTATGRQIIIHAAVKSSTGTVQVPIGQPVETETAQAIVAAFAPAISQAIEVETAQAMTVTKYVPLGQAIELEEAQPANFSGVTINVTLGQPIELETAQPLTVTRYVSLGQATEVETAQAFTPTGQTAFRVGLWRNKPTDTGSWRTKLNRDLAIFDGAGTGPWSYYLANGSALPAEVIAAYNEGHDILLYHKGASGMNWVDIRTGQATSNANFNALADSIIANIDPARPIIYAGWHEPENDTPAQGSPADYALAYRKIEELFAARGIGTRVKYQMTYMNSHAHPAGTMEGFWPTKANGTSFIQVVSQQTYITCGATTNIATKHLEDFQYLRDNRTASRKWSDLDNNDRDGKRVELAISEYGMDLGGDEAPCGVVISPGVVGDIGTAAHRALGFDRIRAVLQSYVDYNCKYLTLFNARTDSISTETNTSADGAAYQLLINAMNTLGEIPDQLHVVGGAVELETAQAFAVTKYVPLGQAVELETAQQLAGNIGVPQVHTLGTAVEEETAQPMLMQSVGPGPIEVIPLPAPDYTFHIDPPDYHYWVPAPDWDLEE